MKTLKHSVAFLAKHKNCEAGHLAIMKKLMVKLTCHNDDNSSKVIFIIIIKF